MNARVSVAGFTLLELLMVIALMAVALGVLGVGLSRGLDASRDRQALREIVAALRQTRTQAVLSGAPLQLRFDLPKRSFQAPGQDPRHWPGNLAVQLTTAEALGPAVAFFPDGSSSGGHLLVERAGQRWRIDVGWLNGNVRWQAVQ
ncbi:putative general secretion pathway protein H [Pseudomonas sp. CFII64]|uniref:GspH/FimT family pseudopilin n=1 Tax=Pseudomonas sp. CFII64 TaxID=911242 RepID=UPI000357682F|nr:GspH/FimT family pseudopilin [Pseudomonas sp. CFII64]EPJ79892.1 putative general secretion pathway protein H [Pseudomonas sp. CFII64]